MNNFKSIITWKNDKQTISEWDTIVLALKEIEFLTNRGGVHNMKNITLEWINNA